MHDFKDMSQVLNHVEEVLVIDLMEHVTSMEEKYIDALIDAPKGLYIVGNIEPLLLDSNTYYPKSLYPNPKRRIAGLTDLVSYSDDIVNAQGETVVTLKDLILKAKFLKQEPTVPVIAIKAAISVVEQYLTSSSWYTKRSHPQHRLEFLVRSEFQDMVVNDEYFDVFQRLRKQVMSFVGDDQWNIYFTKVKGTNLIVEKSIDYRIYCYYENIFKEQDEQDNDT